MNCCICNGKCEKEVVHGTYTYWKCRQCFTSQILPKPSEDELCEFYNKFHLCTESGGLYDEFEERMQADFQFKANLVRRHGSTSGPRVLDVGCGKGYFVQTLKKNGFDAEGIDISQSAVNHATNLLGVKAKNGKINDYVSDWRESYEVITLWATIEHLANPMEVIDGIYKCLKPGGILLCDTGLGNAPYEKFLPGHSQWYDAPQHLFVFSSQGLITLLEKAGFKVLSTDTNSERSLMRRFIKVLRHTLLCLLGFGVFYPLLGRAGFLKMRENAKWPIGRLMMVTAQK